MSVIPTPHVGDVGTEIMVELDEDLSQATTLRIVIRRPTDTDRFLVKTPTSVGATHVVYTTEDGDLSTEGTYNVQVYYADTAWQGYSTIPQFDVSPRLYDVAKGLS